MWVNYNVIDVHFFIYFLNKNIKHTIKNQEMQCKQKFVFGFLDADRNGRMSTTSSIQITHTCNLCIPLHFIIFYNLQTLRHIGFCVRKKIIIKSTNVFILTELSAQLSAIQNYCLSEHN